MALSILILQAVTALCQLVLVAFLWRFLSKQDAQGASIVPRIPLNRFLKEKGPEPGVYPFEEDGTVIEPSDEK